MSTLPVDNTPEPLWKQEVSRRLAERRTRRTSPQESQETLEQPLTRAAASSRAAQAAARVAARYAQAPSYAELDSTSVQPELPFAPSAPALPAAPAVAAPVAAKSAPVEPLAPQPVAVSAPAPVFAEPVAAAPRYELAPPVAAAEDNLLFFPSEPAVTRESVAPAPAPRHAPSRGQEASFAFAGSAALNFFAAEPEAAPAVAVASALPADAAPEPVVAAVAAPEPERAPEPACEPYRRARIEVEEEIELRPDPTPNATSILQIAPINRRLMAFLVDAGLIALTFLALAWVLALSMETLPALPAMRSVACWGLGVVAMSYLLFFTAFAESTPGMNYAGLKLRHFNNCRPSREQRLTRLAMLLLMTAPCGLGFCSALFDKNRLGWHDRLSHTFQWKR